MSALQRKVSAEEMNGDSASDVGITKGKPPTLVSPSAQPQQQQQCPPENPPPAATKKTKKKRTICSRCHRPKPQTCLCEHLPATPIRLKHTEVIVLQHPLELKNYKAHSHRSVPVLKLCLDDRSLVLCKGRRLGPESLGSELWRKLWGRNGNPPSETSVHNNLPVDDTKSSSGQPPETNPKTSSGSNENHGGGSSSSSSESDCSYLPVLVFPKLPVGDATAASSQGSASLPENDAFDEASTEILSLHELIQRWRNEKIREASVPAGTERISSSLGSHSNGSHRPLPCNKKLLLLVLDATWKHAKEMHKANLREGVYPPHMIQLALQPKDLEGFVPGRFCIRKTPRGGGGKSKDPAAAPAPEEPSGWMSTAECLAWILAGLEPKAQPDSEAADDESNTGLYRTLMKPLDAMVDRWNSFILSSQKQKQQQHSRSNKRRRTTTKQPPAHTTPAAAYSPPIVRTESPPPMGGE